SLQTQLEEGRHTYTLLEERLQRHAAELSHERNENQAYREQLELVRQERDQLQEHLSQTQVEKQSFQTQLEELRHTHTLLEEKIQRHAAELSHERNENQAYREQLE